MYTDLYICILGATGVDNGNGGGWCHDMVGDHAVKLHGRTYSFLPPAKKGVGPSGGLSYFTFDSRAALAAHGASRNRPSSTDDEEPKTDVINTKLLTALYNELADCNRLCLDVARFGEESHLKDLIDGNVTNEGPNTLTAIAKVSSFYLYVF
jgi:hypothetical protein